MTLANPKTINLVYFSEDGETNRFLGAFLSPEDAAWVKDGVDEEIEKLRHLDAIDNSKDYSADFTDFLNIILPLNETLGEWEVYGFNPQRANCSNMEIDFFELSLRGKLDKII